MFTVLYPSLRRKRTTIAAHRSASKYCRRQGFSEANAYVRSHVYLVRHCVTLRARQSQGPRIRDICVTAHVVYILRGQIGVRKRHDFVVNASDEEHTELRVPAARFQCRPRARHVALGGIDFSVRGIAVVRAAAVAPVVMKVD